MTGKLRLVEGGNPPKDFRPSGPRVNCTRCHKPLTVVQEWPVYENDEGEHVLGLPDYVCKHCGTAPLLTLPEDYED